jgi:UDP-glucose 4-epimerase
MKFFITGAAGFIGSSLADALIARGDNVVGYDNLSTGNKQFIPQATKFSRYEFVEGDVLDEKSLKAAMASCDMVLHLSANADVRFGTDHPSRDLEQNTIATFKVLEAMRANSIKRIAFSSTGSVYGEAKQFPTPEDVSFPIQTSLYGASKLACEGLIAAYAEGFGFQGIVFRFVSILGPRYTHGHVFDFYKQLLANPTSLQILGDGKQRKSYLHIDDCVAAITIAIEKTNSKFEIFNLGTDHYCQVDDSVGWILSELKLNITREYAGGERGWIGDNPFIFLDCSRIRKLGWQPRYTIEEGVRSTLTWLRGNPWVLENRT